MSMMLSWYRKEGGPASLSVNFFLFIFIPTGDPRHPTTLNSRFYLVNTYYLTRMYRTPRQIGHASNSSSERPAVDTRACAGADVPEDPLRDVLRQTSYVWYQPAGAVTGTSSRA